MAASPGSSIGRVQCAKEMTMRFPLFQFLFRCGVAIAASAVLLLAMTQAGAAGTSDGVCASVQQWYVSLNWLQSGVRPMAILARFCDA